MQCDHAGSMSMACRSLREPTPRSLPEIPGMPESPTFAGSAVDPSDVLDLHDLDLFLACGRAHLHDVAFEGAHDGAGDGRDPAHMALREVDLVDADDLDRALLALLVGAGDGGTEEDLVGRGPLGRVDDLRALQPLAEETDAPVDLAQA